MTCHTIVSPQGLRDGHTKNMSVAVDMNSLAILASIIFMLKVLKGVKFLK